MVPSIQQQFASGINTADVDMLRKALSSGADPNLGPLGERTFYPLLRVCERTHHLEKGLTNLRILQMLMRNNADPFNFPSREFPGGVLYFYLNNRKKNDDKAVDIILKNWNSPKPWNKILMGGGNTLLHASLYDVRISRVLLRHGIEVNAQNDAGQTPLMCSMSMFDTDPEVVSCLLSNGADPYIVNRKGQSAMWLAIGSSREDTNIPAVQTMLAYGYDHRKEPNLGKIKDRLNKTMADRKDCGLQEQLEALLPVAKQISREKLMLHACKHRKNPDEHLISPKPKI